MESSTEKHVLTRIREASGTRKDVKIIKAEARNASAFLFSSRTHANLAKPFSVTLGYYT